ncbi:uncharacterized protein LOC144019412 [Festucalex cinctus]
MESPNHRVDVKVAFYGWKYRHYFKMLECRGKNIRVKCTLCPGEKCLSTSVVSNSNLLKHLNSAHAKLQLKAQGRSTRGNAVDRGDCKEGKVVPGGPRFEIINGSSVNVASHPVLLLPLKMEPGSSSSGDTDVSDVNLSEKAKRRGRGGNGSSRASYVHRAEEADDLRTLYCSYLKKEIANRDQEIAYRALKMRKLEKELLLLDKQLM